MLPIPSRGENNPSKIIHGAGVVFVEVDARIVRAGNGSQQNQIYPILIRGGSNYGTSVERSTIARIAS